MKNLLKSYVEKFNSDDVELYRQDIDNDQCLSWLGDNVPLVELPDKTIEEIYYFRWWTFRKHLRSTEDGIVITEFLPKVPWSGKHNTIIAAAGHHVSEAKWLKSCKKIIENYLRFWLEEKGNTYLYSSWLIYSVYEYCKHINDFTFGINNLPLLINFYQKTHEEHITETGLYWSIDGNDAMECSISGSTVDLKSKKGIRPTLNSYMAANAFAISEFARLAGNNKLHQEYLEKFNVLKDKINNNLYNDGFYKAYHIDNLDLIDFNNLPNAQNVRELLGFIPWIFNIPPKGREEAFLQLKLSDGFLGEYGLYSAEKRHERFLFDMRHECLWNGYIWPFATTQTLNAIINLLDNYEQDYINKNDFYSLLKTYAESQYLIKDGGEKVCWIDEVKDPRTNLWSSRELLRDWGWKENLGGIERGKDYNHSTFCDLILGGLLDIKSINGNISVKPKIPDDWDYFKVDNLSLCGRLYTIIFDKNGNRYKKGNGLKIIEKTALK